MVHTPNDLQDAIRERADRAPTPRPELLMAPLGARHIHRRAGIVIAAAAVAVATVAIAPSLLRHDQGPAARRSAAKPATVSSASTPVPRPAALPALLAPRTWIGYNGRDAVDSFDTVQAQYIELRPLSGGFQVREITAFAPGLFSKSLIRNPQPVTVNGVKGYFGAVLPWRNDNVSHTDPAQTDPRGSKYPDPMPAVLWKIGADQWAAVISNAPGEGSAAALTAIASRVHVTAALVRAPIKIGYLPSGFKLSDVEHGAIDGQSPANSSEVGFRRDTKYDYPEWSVTVTPVPKPGASYTCATCVSIYPEVHRTVGNHVITVQTFGAITKAQAERVLASVTLARRPDSPNDSWFTLAQALP